MKKPWYQNLIRNISFILLGVLMFGAILDSISNAVSVLTSNIALWSTIILIVFWVGIEAYLLNKPIIWNYNGSLINITRLGPKIRLPIIGIIILLWIPTIFSQDDGKDENPFNPNLNRNNTASILILPFEDYVSCPQTKVNAHLAFKDKIEKTASEVGLPISIKVIEKLDLSITSKEINELGKEHRADLVVWGNFEKECDKDSTHINVKLSFIQNKQYHQGDSLIFRASQTPWMDLFLFIDFGDSISRSLESDWESVKNIHEIRSWAFSEPIENVVNFVMAVTTYAKDGNFFNTISHLEKMSVSNDPNFNSLVANFTALVGWICNLVQLHDQAVRAYCITDKFIKLETLQKWLPGETYYEIKNSDSTLSYLYGYLDLFPHLSYPYKVIGSCLIDKGQFLEAKEHFDKAIALQNPIQPEPYFFRSVCLDNLAFPPESIISDLKNSLKYYGNYSSNSTFDSAMCYALIANKFGWMKDSCSEFAYLDSAIMYNPANKDLFSWRAKRFSQSGDYQRSKSDFIKYLELEPSHPEPRFELGRIFFIEEKYDSVVYYMTPGFKNLGKDSYGIHINFFNPVIRSFIELGTIDSAEVYMDKAIENSPFSSTHKAIGLSNLIIGKYKKALSHFEKALDLDTTNFHIHYNNIANTYRLLGDLSLSEEYTAKSIALNDSNGYAYATKAMLLADQGDPEGFIKYIKKAIDSPYPYPVQEMVRYENTLNKMLDHNDFFQLVCDELDSLHLQLLESDL